MNHVLWVDYRTGSIELLPALQKLGIDAREATAPGLDSADFAFTGHGPDGDAEFGVERKTLTDFVDSARSGRLYGVSTEQHESQLTRMLSTYDFAWVLVEGEYATDRKGRLIQFKNHRRSHDVVPGNFTEDSLNKTLLSLELQTGVHIKQTTGQIQTVRWLASLFRSYTDKKWDQHSTMRTLQRRESIKPVSTFRDMVMRMCDGDLGFAVSKAVEAHVRKSLLDVLLPNPTLADMLLRMTAMTLHDWENLEVPERGGTSRKFGTARALRVIDALRRAR